MKKNKYQIGDLFIESRFGLYRGILSKIDKDTEEEYVICWINPSGNFCDTGYNKSEVVLNIRDGLWKYFPVVK